MAAGSHPSCFLLASGACRPLCFLPYKPLHPEDRGSMSLRNVSTPPQHYTASQPRRPGLGLHISNTHKFYFK